MKLKTIIDFLKNSSLKFNAKNVVNIVGSALDTNKSDDQTIADIVIKGLSIGDNAFKGTYGSQRFATDIVKMVFNDRLSKKYRDEKQREWMINNLTDSELQKLLKDDVSPRDKVRKNVKDKKDINENIKDINEQIRNLREQRKQKNDDFIKYNSSNREIINEEKAQEKLNDLIDKKAEKLLKKINEKEENLQSSVEKFQTPRFSANDETGKAKIRSKKAFSIKFPEHPKIEDFKDLSTKSKIELYGELKKYFEEEISTSPKRKKYIKKNITINMGGSKGTLLETDENFQSTGNEISDETNLFGGFTDEKQLEKAKEFFKETLKFSDREIKKLENERLLKRDDYKDNDDYISKISYKSNKYEKKEIPKQFDTDLVKEVLNQESNLNIRQKLETLERRQQEEIERRKNLAQNKAIKDQQKAINDQIKKLQETKKGLNESKVNINEQLKQNRIDRDRVKEFDKQVKAENEKRENKIERAGYVVELLKPKKLSPTKASKQVVKLTKPSKKKKKK